MGTMEMLLVVMTEMLDELMTQTDALTETNPMNFQPSWSATMASGRRARMDGVALEDNPNYSERDGKRRPKAPWFEAWEQGWNRRDKLEKALQEAAATSG